MDVEPILKPCGTMYRQIHTVLLDNNALMMLSDSHQPNITEVDTRGAYKRHGGQRSRSLVSGTQSSVTDVDLSGAFKPPNLA